MPIIIRAKGYKYERGNYEGYMYFSLQVTKKSPQYSSKC